MRASPHAMTPKALINLIVGQTTIMIAQLSTAAGIRAPLGDIAGQLFLELSRAIEAEGVSRKVVADMFGLALRGYQKKVQRLEESMTDRGTTLWEAVLSHVEANGPLTRQEVEDRFSRDDQLSVAAVLNDLVSSGLLDREGPRDGSSYSARAQSSEYLDRSEHIEELGSMIWVLAYNEPGLTSDEIAQRLSVPKNAVDEALERLEVEGVILQNGDANGVRVNTLIIPVGAEYGWTAAVFDHYRAVATSIGKKLQTLGTEDSDDQRLGGTTITFDVHANNPHREEVMDLLEETRRETDRLWAKVRAWNEKNPQEEEERTRVTFYVGQSFTEPFDSNGK